VGPGCEPPGVPPLLVDISSPEVFMAWKSSMEAHASQMRTRRYVDLQIARARVLGIGAGTDYAQALYPGGTLLLGSLALIARPSRQQ
jgi:hypothetical protein